MSLGVSVADYVGSLTIGQGRYAGEPFRLLGWQRRFLSGAFRGPGDAALSMGRGGGKSTFCAAIAAAAVDVDGPLVEPMAECVVVASSFDQGTIIFRHLLHFLQPSFDRYGRGGRGRFRVQDSANRSLIVDRETGAMVKVHGSDPRRLHGLAPKLLVLDEVSQWEQSKRDAALAALRTSRGKIPDSRALWIGTRPSDPAHPFQKALDGHGVRFALSYQAGKDDPPFQKRTWIKANPSLRHGFPDLEDVIRSEAAEARRDPDALASFQALRLNMGTSDVVRSVLLDSSAWSAAVDLGEPSEGSSHYTLGIDLGSGAAMSAASAYFRDGRLDSVAVFPRHPSLAERGLADGVGALYTKMARRGELLVAGHRVADIEGLLGEALDRWGTPQAIVCDRWREQELRQSLAKIRFPRAAIVTRGMGYQDGGADCLALRKAVLGGYVRPVESLLLTAAMAEARVVVDAAGNAKLAKNTEGGRRHRAKDDAAAAAILAVAAGFREWHQGPARARSGVYLGRVGA